MLHILLPSSTHADPQVCSVEIKKLEQRHSLIKGGQCVTAIMHMCGEYAASTDEWETLGYLPGDQAM